MTDICKPESITSRASRRLGAVGRFLDTTETVLKSASIVLLGVTVVCLSYAVVMRYVFQQPPAWSMELSRFLFIWMIIFGASLVTREESHIQVNLIVSRMPASLRFIWMNLLRVLMIGFCIVLVQQGIAIYPTVAEATTPTLGLSVGYLYLAIPFGGVLMGVYLLEAIVRSVVDRSQGSGNGE